MKRKKSCEEGEQISPLPHLISFMDFHTSELSNAIRFIRDVKARLFCHPDKLYSFAKVLRSSLVGSLTTTVDKDYTKKVREILDGHDDLILRFNLHFLPPSCGTSHLTEIVDYEAKKLVEAEETISDVFEVNKKGKEMVMGCGENVKGKSFKTIVEVMKGKEKMGCGENHRKKRDERIEYDDEDEGGDEEGPSCKTSHLPEIVESEAKKLVDAEETVSDGFEVNKKGKEMVMGCGENVKGKSFNTVVEVMKGKGKEKMGCGENLRKKNEERIEYDDEDEGGDEEGPCKTSHLPEIVESEVKKLVDAEETVSDGFEVNKKGKKMMGCGENVKGKSFNTVVEVMKGKGKEKMGCGENLRKKNEERIEYDDEDEGGDEEGPCKTSHLPEIVESEAKKLVDAEENVSDGFEVNKKGKEMMGCGENVKGKSFNTVVEVMKGKGKEKMGCGENLRKKNEERIEYDDGENEKGDIEKGLPEQVLRLFGKVQERLSCSEKYISFLRNIYDYTKQIIDKAELVDAVSALIGRHSDLMSELNKYLKNHENVDEQPRNEARVIETRRCGERRKRRQEMDFLSKPIHELDLSKCERCTPSYRLLPEEYPISVVKGRTKLGARVLNDSWVCVPSGEVVYPAKERRQNGQEKVKSLVKLEDDIHELDLLVSRFVSAKVYAKKLEEGRRGESRIGDWSEAHMVEEWNVDMVEGKEIDFLSCVKQIYGEKGEEVIDALRNDSARALPVILVRLQQKLEEVKQYRSCFHKKWADLYMPASF